tara:strand:+ start:1622 stop:1972 length:351 start_codon:yes stop_codon:yes gene_type:complete
MNEVKGKIKLIGETKEFGSNGFTKRNLVVTTDDQYPQHILIEFAKDKCELISNFNIGDNVKVSINLRGREWESPQGEIKYFNSLEGWRIESEGNAQEKPSKPSFTDGSDEKDLLPF